MADRIKAVFLLESARTVYDVAEALMMDENLCLNAGENEVFLRRWLPSATQQRSGVRLDSAGAGTKIELFAPAYRY
ncbi:MAG: hypothetical protein Q4D38_05840 [Planctomycetia bacterium]|nr:hypothetical protein [Planctomycetia bacterium]